jgi:hypothetical protein
VYRPGSGALDLRQQASSQYNTGTWSGEIYEDSVSAASHDPVSLQLVAIDSQSQFFTPGACGSQAGYEGVLGLGPPGAAIGGTSGYFDALVSSRHLPDLFAFRLCDASGTLWLGGYDPSSVTAQPVYTPMVSGASSVYYAVSLASIGAAGAQVAVPTGQYRDTLVDTGSNVFILPTAVFQQVTAAIAGSPGFASVFGNAGASWFSDPTRCQPLSKSRAELDAALPPLTLLFGSGPTVSVQAPATQSYLVPANGNQWCPALYAMDPSAQFPVAAVLGSPILRSSVVVVDRANQRIGFAPPVPCAAQ